MPLTRLVMFITMSAALGGCFARPAVKLDVQIRRYESGNLRSCDIVTGWTPEQTEALCGAPIGRLDQVGTAPGPCMIYDNISKAIRSDLRPARWLAVCFEHAEARVAYVSGAKQQEVVPAGWVLTSVVGLAEPPPGVVAK